MRVSASHSGYTNIVLDDTGKRYFYVMISELLLLQ
ncbi:hypothetical protein BDD30_3654 [Photorhabdus asymbiotica]|uniref:Uncharacterized protein n=1 Tax=Photorhabdus asymbiotica TaxID=291112 RepID=A0ABX9SIR7_9GAMM|nr:hypothetical protein BDD30_3654 [Photorhabdus asymbiotica]